MKGISEASLKKAILAVEAERLKNPSAFRPDRAQRATLRKSRRELDKMVSGFLRDAGFSIKRFQELQQQRSVELERMVARHKADAVRRAARQKYVLPSRIVQQAKALADLGSRKDFFSNPTIVLDTPFLIWSIPLEGMSSAAVPFGSWAKFKFATSRYRGPQKFGFYFYWVNPYNDYAVINPASAMAATGHLKAHAPWTVGVNTSWVAAYALLNLWFGWPDDVTSAQHGSAFLGNVGAFASTFTGSDTEGTSISSAPSLDTTIFAVPPGNTMVFEVALLLDYENDDGDIEADFESGDFQITCPVVWFSLLNSPPSAIA